jgi:putative restriction endonuclease
LGRFFTAEEGKRGVKGAEGEIIGFFRRKILAAYNNTCCITGISQPELLIAGHIRPWGIDEKNRLNPSNGIAINALHDKAFEAGLLTITPNYTIKISNQILKKNDSVLFDYLGKFENKKISLPSRFLPDISFLQYHNKERYKN